MSIVVEKPGYVLEVAADGLRATLSPVGGETWLTLRPHVALDTVDGVDETLSVTEPTLVDGRIVIERRSTLWDRAAVTIECTDTQLEIRASVSGKGRLATADLLALRALMPDRPTGLLPSGYAVGRVTKLFCPNPARATGIRPVSESAVIGVAGDGEPGRHHWFFTPAPLYLAWGREDEEEWLDLGIVAPVEELTFVEASYAPREGGFHLRLEYDGHTEVDGAFEAPTLVLTPGVPDPSTGLRRHREDLVARGAAPAIVDREPPALVDRPHLLRLGRAVLPLRDLRRLADGAGDAGKL